MKKAKAKALEKAKKGKSKEISWRINKKNAHQYGL